MSTGDSPEIMSQRIIAGIVLAGRLGVGHFASQEFYVLSAHWLRKFCGESPRFAETVKVWTSCRVSTEVTFGRSDLSVCPLGGFMGAQECIISN